jgi:hypothetical protein
MHDRPFQEHTPSPAQGWASSASGGKPDPVQEYHALACELQADDLETSPHQLDKQIAWIMAHYDGYSPAAIAQAMREASVHLAHYGGDAQAYVERTIDEAMQEDPYEGTALGWGA